MISVVSTIDSDDGNELISSFIKGDDGSKSQEDTSNSEEEEETNVLI